MTIDEEAAEDLCFSTIEQMKLNLRPTKMGENGTSTLSFKEVVGVPCRLRPETMNLRYSSLMCWIRIVEVFIGSRSQNLLLEFGIVVALLGVFKKLVWTLSLFISVAQVGLSNQAQKY